MSVAGRLVLIAGATSESGLATARELRDAGARVVAVGHDPDKLRRFAQALETDAGPLSVGSSGAVRTEVCDLTDERDVAALAERVREADGPVDGVLHLVGGWRGGGGLAGQSDDDYRFLERSLSALRHVSRAFDADLRASESARTAIVSSTAVERPLAGGANYAAVKAASEAWARAVAQGFAKDARDAGRPLAAASVIFRTKSLSGLEGALAQRFSDLWMTDAADLNDTIVELTDPSL
ncbi:SDR family NAD(P)-dependent oxidoreductase [Microbacterium hibisci]|uniref:SDR family NAD(P)-dependent oxidoreductase n=1 Tax=Microbacterium hibisci TaxID=2036000 RepID=UPI0019446036|nr:SDR family oxidoreductase [Microbacterium hibisci]